MITRVEKKKKKKLGGAGEIEAKDLPTVIARTQNYLEMKKTR